MADKSILSEFEVTEELDDKLTALVNTNEEGSEAVFRFLRLLDEENGIALVEKRDEETKTFEKCKVRFRANIIRLIQSEKILENGLYYIKYVGKKKITGGKSVCIFETKALKG